jgi:hypothetical protein
LATSEKRSAAEFLGVGLHALKGVAVLFGAMLALSTRAEDLVDPTRPPAGYEEVPATAAEDGPPPRVSAIQIGAHARHAVVNGRAARVGETVDGFEIVAIEPGRMTLRRNGKLSEVPLLQAVRITTRKGR